MLIEAGAAYKISVLKNVAKFTGKCLHQSLGSADLGHYLN